MRFLRNVALGLAALVAGSFSAWPAAAPAADASKPTRAKTADLFGDNVVVKAKGFEIKRSQLDEEVIRLKALAAARNQPVPPEQSVQMEKQILEQLIQIQLLQSKATEADKAAGKELAQRPNSDPMTPSPAGLNRKDLPKINCSRSGPKPALLRAWSNGN
jgi:hypothetical protein